MVGLAAALLAVLAAIALSRSVSHAEYERVDARLASELAGAVRAVERLGSAARAEAVRLAASAEVQRAMANRDTPQLEALAARRPGVGFEVGGKQVAGPASPEALAVRAAVVAQGEIGRVVVELPVEAVARQTALA